MLASSLGRAPAYAHVVKLLFYIAGHKAQSDAQSSHRPSPMLDNHYAAPHLVPPHSAVHVLMLAILIFALSSLFLFGRARRNVLSANIKARKCTSSEGVKTEHSRKIDRSTNGRYSILYMLTGVHICIPP